MSVSPVSPSAISAGLAGMRNSMVRAGAAAERIASGSNDLVGDAVELAQAGNSHQAAVSVLKVAGEMQEAALDILV